MRYSKFCAFSVFLYIRKRWWFDIDIKKEALDRMKLLQLHPNVINEFKNENKLNRSEFSKGILYWLTDEERQ